MTIEEHENIGISTTEISSPSITTPGKVLSIAELAQALSAELHLGSGQIVRTVALLDEGNTIPFIARYRKEMTGSLDEVNIQAIADRTVALRALHERRADVRRLIEAQGKLTPDLTAAISASHNAARSGRHLFALSAKAQNTR